MSLETTLGSFFLNKSNSDAFEKRLLSSLNKFSESIDRFVEIQPQYQPILKSDGANFSSNVADGVIIDKSFRVPQGHRLVVEDFNVNFTTVAGTVRIVILDANDNEVTDVLRDITGSTNGTGRTVLDQGERIAIVGQSAGAGIFGVYISGFLQKMVIS